MFYSFFLLLALACLGEFTVFNFLDMSSQQPPLWLLYILPCSFILGVVLAKENKGPIEKIRRYIQLETLFIIGMIFYIYMLYTTKNHPLINFGYFMIYSMALSSCFIFREFSTYLYLLSCSLLFGVSQLYDVSDPILKAGFYLASLVFCIVIHNDYMNHKYIAQSNRTKMFPFVITAVSVVAGVMIMTWMTFATPKISNYLDSVALIRNYFTKQKQPVTPQITQKNSQTNTQPSKNQQQQKKQQQNTPQNIQQNTQQQQQHTQQQNDKASDDDENPIANHTQVSLNNDLKFGDVDFSKISPRKLFEVELATETLGNVDIHPQDLYWKLGHLDTYDAQNGYWYLRNTQQQELPRNNGGWITLSTGKPPFAHNKILQLYTLYAQTSRLYYLTHPGYTDIKRGLRDRGGNIFPETQGRQYHVVSYVPTKRTKAPYDIMNVDYRYISVPQNIRRYQWLAQKITKNFRRPYDKVKAVQRYLQTRYKYDLQPGIRSGDATYQFLFEKRRGYCQHFASAMVLLLRSIDIPARVAVGCHGGIWDANKQVYVVSSIHRHAWVEVPFQFLGWTTFDPVPTDDPQIEDDFTRKVEEFKRRENIQSADNIVHNSNGNRPQNRRQTNSHREREKDLAQNTQNNNNDDFASKFKNNDVDNQSFDNRNLGNKNLENKHLAESSERRPVDHRSEAQQKKRRSNQDVFRPNANTQAPNSNTGRSQKSFAQKQRERFKELIDKRLQQISREKQRQRQQQKRQEIEQQRQREAQRQLAKQKKRSQTVEQQQQLDTLTHKTTQQKNAKTSNNSAQKSSKQSTDAKAANGIITFIKNMTIFCVSFVFIVIFCYVIPQIVKTIHFLIKVLFSKSEKHEETENVPKWGKMIAKVLAPKKKIHTELGKIIHEYTQLSKKLETFGLQKQTHQTPTEYLHFLQKQVSATTKQNMQMLTQLFLKAKYSPYEVGSDDVVLFKQYCETIFSDIRKVS